MSAIAGLWSFEERPDVEGDCARMLAAQQVYGPHDCRQWSEGYLAMGRRLFRTLPEDTYDHQPLHSRDGRLTLVSDVRLDNRDELIARLDLATGDAHRLCDAAILLESLDRWGETALDRLVGDFAFALWDAPARKLLLARDFSGQRPLHYHRGEGFFAFASMPKGLHALAEVPYGPDEQAVAESIVLLPRLGKRSFFRDISRVEPAHIVTVTRDDLLSRRYWRPQRKSEAHANTTDYVEGLRHHLDQATKMRLRGAKGAVGTQLSAGLDSGAVTTTAARLLAPSGGRVIAFTAVPGRGYVAPTRRNRFDDEGPLAAATAALYSNIEHVFIRSGHCSPIEGLDRNFFLYDHPVQNLANAVWGRAIRQAARERKLDIMLSGQMGNITLSYDGLELLPELLRSGHIVKLWRMAAKLIAKTDMRWRGALVKTFGPFTPDWLWQWANQTFLSHKNDVLVYTAIRAERLNELYLAALTQERDLNLSYRPWSDGFAMRLWVISRVDPGNLNKGALGGWGIDQRDPTADKRLVEYCLSLPSEQYLSDGVTRALAKRALADRLPQAVLNERKRGYQAADWHEGLNAARADIAAELDRLAACAPAAKALDIEKLKRLVENWPSGGWERDDVLEPYRLALLRGIATGHFLRKASGANQ